MADQTPKNEFEVVINAPLEDVWHVLATRFEHIEEWASGIPKSWKADVAGDADAPVPGRVCASTLRGFDDVVETIVDYGEEPYFFTYRGTGMPGWMGTAANTWHVEAIDETTTRVYFEPEVQPGGLFGRIMVPLFMVAGRRMAHETLDDLKVYVETGAPSARKQKKTAKQEARQK